MNPWELCWLERLWKDRLRMRMPIRNEKGDVALFLLWRGISGSSIRQELNNGATVLVQKEAGYLVHLCEDDPRLLKS